jgi:hypothetical protein
MRRIIEIKGAESMKTALALGVAVWAAAAVFWASGCNSAPSGTAGPKTGEVHDHDHEHVHHGPHNGHLMEIGGEEYHAEWTRDESGKVTFYVLDADAKKEVPINAEKITIDVKIGENAPKTYELMAVTPADGKSAAFEIVDKQFASLFDQLKSPGIVLTLHVEINGNKFDQVIKEHEHEH